MQTEQIKQKLQQTRLTSEKPKQIIKPQQEFLIIQMNLSEVMDRWHSVSSKSPEIAVVIYKVLSVRSE